MSYSHQLDDGEKAELLRIARTSLKEYLATGRLPPGAPHKKSLLEPAGVFVSLQAGEKLRGCIGTITASLPLYKAIMEMTMAAASRDPRFDPVSSDELTLLTIEVSVLGPRKTITSPTEIELGTHGVCVSSGSRRGLLLPKVAAEEGWDGETFLVRTCQKAGLPADAWRLESTRVEIFSAQVFAEELASGSGDAAG
jgi:AmmeMemoRadiSam system protein A